MDKIAYALGLSIGQNLAHSGVKNINSEDFVAGMKDVLAGNKPQITLQEAQQVLDKFFKELEEQTAGAAKAEGEKFLAENAKRPSVKVTDSGLQYEVLEATLGQKPKATDRGKVHYRMARFLIAVIGAVSLSRLPSIRSSQAGRKDCS